MTAPEEDRTAEYLTGNRYPLGRSIRDHFGAYVDNIPTLLDSNNALVNETLDRVKDMADDDPLTKEILEDTLRLNHVSQTMAAVHHDLSDLLAFIDWEHSFHEVAPTDMTPGHRSMVLQLVRRADGSLGIQCRMMNGGQTSAEIVIGRNEALALSHAFAGGVQAIDKAAEQ